jgi:hypothetical protein
MLMSTPLFIVSFHYAQDRLFGRPFICRWRKRCFISREKEENVQKSAKNDPKSAILTTDETDFLARYLWHKITRIFTDSKQLIFHNEGTFFFLTMRN